MDAINQASLVWHVNRDDFFPYADLPYAYWTGTTASPFVYMYQYADWCTYLSMMAKFTLSANILCMHTSHNNPPISAAKLYILWLILASIGQRKGLSSIAIVITLP
jgi:hypothetical protein